MPAENVTAILPVVKVTHQMQVHPSMGEVVTLSAINGTQTTNEDGMWNGYEE